MNWIRLQSKRGYPDRSDTAAYANSFASYAYGLNVLGRHTKALEQANEALAVHAENQFARQQKLVAEGSLKNARGLEYYAKNKFEQAIQLFEEALSFALDAHDTKRQSTYLSNHGLCLIKMGRYVEALLKLSQAVDLDPDSKSSKEWHLLAEKGLGRQQSVELNDQGIRFLKLKEYDRALETYATAYKMTPPGDVKDRAILLTNQALALIYLKRFADAIEKCNEALKIDPSCTMAKMRIELASRSYNQTVFGWALQIFKKEMRNNLSFNLCLSIYL